MNKFEPQPREFMRPITTSEEMYQDVFQRLGLTPEQLKDKTIIDIGSAAEAYLGEGIKREFPSSHVVNIDHFFGRNVDVKAKAQQLPFADQAFDIVLAHHSVPIAERITKDPFLAMREMIRVVKSGGVIKIVPFRLRDEYTDSNGQNISGKQVLEQLQQENPTLTYQIIKLGAGDSRLEITKQ